MTIGAWVLFGIIAIGVLVIAVLISEDAISDNNYTKAVVTFIIAIAIILATLIGLLWYFNNTASGMRAMTDQKSELANGLERTVTVYTADGEVIAQYTGKIDLEDNEGGYVIFDYDGKRYTYYNCFVESIANIE